MIKRTSIKALLNFIYLLIDSESHEKMFSIETEFPNQILQMMDSSLLCKARNLGKELEIVENYLKERTFPAIGEIGIDLFWDKRL